MSVAEVKLQAGAGGSLIDILKQIKTTTQDVGSENAKILGQIRDQAKAEHDAAQAAREKGEAERKAAQEAAKVAKALREQKRAAEEAIQSFDRMANTTLNIVKNLADTYTALEKIAGVKSFSEQAKSVDDFEESLVRLRLSLENMPQAKFEELVGKDGSKLVNAANMSGMSVQDTIKTMKQIQAETSMGERVMAGDGAVLGNILKFSQVADASPVEAGNALAQFADKFRMSDADMVKASGVLLQQGFQGSLEPNTIPKFVKNSVNYMGLAGKGGVAGFAEMMAMGNIIKDEGGTGGAKLGAATAATVLDSVMKTIADPKKRGMLEKAMGKKLLDKEGHIDFGGFVHDLGMLRRKDPAKFTQLMATYVRDSTARRGLNALAVSGDKNEGGAKAFGKLASPDIQAGMAAIDEGNRALVGTAKAQGRIRDNESLLRAYKGRGKTQELLANIRNDHDNLMTPEQALAEEAGGVTGTFSKYTRYGYQAIDKVFTYGAEKAGLISSDPLQRTKEERDSMVKTRDYLSKDKDFLSLKEAPKTLEEYKAQIERLDRMIALMEDQAKIKPQPPTVNNNITIAPNANVEARVTQEAQPTQSKAQNGSAPTVPKSAGVR